MAAGQYSELLVEDVKDELFDIVRPADPLRITPVDLLVIFHATVPYPTLPYHVLVELPSQRDDLPC